MSSVEGGESVVAAEAEDTSPCVKARPSTDSLSSYMTCDEGNIAPPGCKNGTAHRQDVDDTTTDGSYVSCMSGVTEAQEVPSLSIAAAIGQQPQATFLLLSPTRQEEPTFGGDTEPHDAG